MSTLHRAMLVALVLLQAFAHAHGYGDPSGEAGSDIFRRIQDGNLKKVKELLANNPKLAMARNRDGHYPLKLAALNGSSAIVDALIAAGAKLDIESAVALGKTKEVAAMLKEKPWLAKPPRKPLHIAARLGYLEIAKLLLKYGADPNLDDHANNVLGPLTPLSSAIHCGNYKIAKLLCEHGAKLNVSIGKNYDSPFQYAVARGDGHLMEMLRKYGTDPDAEKGRDDTPAARAKGKASLETLWKAYQAYGLPTPPVEAKLALLTSSSTTLRNRGEHQDHHLVFLIRPANGKQRPVYWAGCDAGPTWQSIEVRPVALKDIKIDKTIPLPFEESYGGRFRTYPDLALAIQCYAKGWKRMAEALLDRSRQPPKRDPFHRIPPRPRDDRAALAELAWNHYCNQFAWSEGDRKPIVERLKKLLAGPHGLDTKAHRNLVADMERTLVAVKTTPGAAEEALEGLLDFDPNWGTWLGSGAGWPGPRNNAESKANYKRLRDLGLSAVPLLLRHRDDFRLTRHVEVNSYGDYTWHLRIADVVAQLLNGLVEEPFAYDFLERDGRGVCLDAAHVNAWWKENAGVKELDYLLKNIEKWDEWGGRGMNEHVLQTLGARYPQELVKLVEKSLSRDSEMLAYLVYPLADSKATAADKGRLLVRIAYIKSPATDKGSVFGSIPNGKYTYGREKALSCLARMKHQDAGRLIIAALENIPKTPDQEYGSTPTTSLAQVAVRSDDERIWAALAKAARRVDVGQRMQLIEGMIVAKPLKRKVLFLRHMKSLLDDKENRDLNSSDRFDGLFAAPMYERIAVRDYAAKVFAHVLDQKGFPEPTWKGADWTQFRERVRARLAELEKTQIKEKK